MGPAARHQGHRHDDRADGSLCHPDARRLRRRHRQGGIARWRRDAANWPNTSSGMGPVSSTPPHKRSIASICRVTSPSSDFHLDDVGAVIAEHLGGIGTHQHGRHVDDLDALQRSHGRISLPDVVVAASNGRFSGRSRVPRVWAYASGSASQGSMTLKLFFDRASRLLVSFSSSSFC